MELSDVNGAGSQVHHIAEPIAVALGLEIVDVECLGRGDGTIVRVVVDKASGVGIQDCEQLHHSLSRALDVADPIPHAYRLEVSSPGLNRPLKRREDYQQAIGRPIRVIVHQPIHGRGTLIGRLAEVTEHGITLHVRARSSRTGVAVPWKAIARATRDVDWQPDATEAGRRPGGGEAPVGGGETPVE